MGIAGHNRIAPVEDITLRQWRSSGRHNAASPVWRFFPYTGRQLGTSFSVLRVEKIDTLHTGALSAILFVCVLVITATIICWPRFLIKVTCLSLSGFQDNLSAWFQHYSILM